MMRREYFPVLWAIVIVSLLTPAIGDAFMYMGLLPKDYIEIIPAIGVLVATCSILLFITCMFVMVMFLCGDDMDDDTYECLFGNGKYNMFWTFPIVGAAIFGYAVQAYIYAIPVTLIFFVLERIRTLQNRRAHEIQMRVLAKEARQESERKEVYLE